MQRSAINCQDCGFSQLCLPFSLNDTELNRLDDIIQRKKPLHKADMLFEAGQTQRCLYAIRTGSFKTFTLTEQGEQQITGFHLPGDIVGFDALSNQQHPSYAEALETAMVCEIPLPNLETLLDQLPRLRQQMMRLMSEDIQADQQMMLLLNRKTAEQKLATFLSQLAQRYASRGFSGSEFRLTMTRSDIGNYLGLTVETISRLLSKLDKEQLIQVNGKLISINDKTALSKLGALTAHC
ncbi:MULTISPECIES: fumarate/nitrate reduction transcriptional regulator Fnr [Rheinheimera]|mgnify:FL=1|jgi:CRP/FNR family transcriptional regulator|uniref:FNR family transcription factor n=1 Tax=Rheinheimera aquimaris TaxID=412437 RepID=A0ABN1DH53_9GAMM|nr:MULTISPECIES: fumarate/nitrate reduction transcriptional regulator Fnr [Rheinheimera]MCB5211932.1 fumarate/nitrate reduction transcriptional regulator Fnr [Rheinheimera aquimaris]MCD1600139.1 fumarate/nitrate reduction transcriptional regulator Fnr [Rheinheimera aquimaris]HBN90408.1 transcriptional regulator FNR [Rheinheimera sp.]|tara:strand:- start:1910 stop:2623 length:714 start_codon:yes stop_codon:yes gene_type:complete